MGTETVEISVGEEGRLFVIHKNLLCSKSVYFNNAFNGGFSEREGKMALKEENPEAFAIFVNWVYKDIIPSINMTSKYQYTVDQQMTHLYKVYIFAHFICLNELQNKAMDAIQTSHRLAKSHPTYSDTRMLFEILPLGHPLRNFAVTCAVYRTTLDDEADIEEFKVLSEEIPEFYDEYMACLRSNTHYYNKEIDPRKRTRTEGGSSWKMPACEFHTHLEEESCHFGEDILGLKTKSYSHNEDRRDLKRCRYPRPTINVL
jgi:hypothetical protein